MSAPDKTEAARYDLAEFAADAADVVQETYGLTLSFEVGFIAELESECRETWDELGLSGSDRRECLVVCWFIESDRVQACAGQNFYPDEYGTSYWQTMQTLTLARLILAARQWNQRQRQAS
jgi:hypothetical protein